MLHNNSKIHMKYGKVKIPWIKIWWEDIFNWYEKLNVSCGQYCILTPVHTAHTTVCPPPRKFSSISSHTPEPLHTYHLPQSPPFPSGSHYSILCIYVFGFDLVCSCIHFSYIPHIFQQHQWAFRVLCQVSQPGSVF